MPSVHDVAAYIVKRTGPITTWKLQKLVYYSQAWSLVWDEKPLFEEQIEAWDNGPVVPDLFFRHRGAFKLINPESIGNADALEGYQRETVDVVLMAYDDFTSQELVDLTHKEAPWVDARRGVPPGYRPSPVITHGAMSDYYGTLTEANAKLL